MQDEEDRDAILARRALFVSTAIAAFSCSPAPDAQLGQPRDQPTTTVEVPAPSSAPSSAPREPTAVPPMRAWKEIMAGAPPIDVSKKLPARDQQQLMQLATVLLGTYGELEKLHANLPAACDVSKPDCKPTWQPVVTKLKETEARLKGMGTPLCGDSGDTLNATIERRRSHAKFIGEVLAELNAHLDAVAASQGMLSEQSWRKLNASSTMPMPCLSCIAPPLQRVPTTIAFAADSSALTPEAETALASVKQMLAGIPAQRFDVRGHADASEREPDKLAAARAKSVRDWLVAHGVAAQQIKAVGVGAELPVDATASEEGRRKNRQLWFEPAAP